MIKIEDKIDCSGCYACYSVCPVPCITMETDSEGFWYPVVDDEKCIKCGACIEACHIINTYEPDNQPEAYAAFALDANVRKVSSSGGVFTVIAESVISDGGVVFGASFDKDFNVNHTLIDNSVALRDFRGSKYVQSKIGETYKQTKALLEEGQKVLFSGTPCQIAGLKQYLKADNPNLLTVDIICHGVPSPKVWTAYKAHIEKAYRDRVTEISFRDKTKGWRNFALAVQFKKKGKYLKALDNDRYLYGFLKNLYLRPSCYACVEKSLHRKSDITLADYWGIEHVHPDFSDDKGISLVFVNSDKGKALFESVKPKLKWINTDIEKGAAQNPAATKSAGMNPNRDSFFSDFDVKPFEDVMKQYCRDTLFTQIIKKMSMLKDSMKSAVKKAIGYKQN